MKEDPKRRGLLVAGTERGVFVSFDDGDSWQPLQLNLPVTSVRDFEIHDNDLIVAHARPRLLGDRRHQRRCGRSTDEIARADAYLFKPADAIIVHAGRRQRHADAEGRAAGGESAERRDDRLLPEDRGDRAGDDRDSRCARYALRNLHQRTGGRLRLRRRGSRRRARCGGRGAGGGIPNTSPLWRPAPEPFSTSAGMHRIDWSPGGGGRGFGGGRGGAPPTLGAFTAKLTVNGQTLHADIHTQTRPALITQGPWKTGLDVVCTIYYTIVIMSLLRDFQSSLRAMRAAPTVSAMAVLSLALGIGANTSIFTLLNSLLLRKIPVVEPERLVTVTSDFAISRGFQSGAGWSYPMWERLQARSDPFDGSLAWFARPLALGQGAQSDVVNGLFVSGGFFKTLGVPAQYGRVLTGSDDVHGGGLNGQVVVVSVLAASAGERRTCRRQAVDRAGAEIHDRWGHPARVPRPGSW